MSRFIFFLFCSATNRTQFTGIIQCAKSSISRQVNFRATMLAQRFLNITCYPMKRVTSVIRCSSTITEFKRFYWRGVLRLIYSLQYFTYVILFRETHVEHSCISTQIIMLQVTAYVDLYQNNLCKGNACVNNNQYL